MKGPDQFLVLVDTTKIIKNSMTTIKWRVTLYSEVRHCRSLSWHGPHMPRGLNLSHLPEQSVHPEGLRPPGDLPGLRQELCHEALLVDLPGGAETFLEMSSVCGVVRGEAEQGVGAPTVSLHQALHTHCSPSVHCVQSDDNMGSWRLSLPH